MFIEEPSWFSVGQTAESLTSSIMDKPHTGLDDSLRILLSCFREKMSDNKPLHGVGQKDNNTFWENLSLLRDSRKFRRHGQIYERGRCRLPRFKVVTNIFPRESVLLGLEPDILSQKHVSMIPRHCRDVLEVCTVFTCGEATQVNGW